MQDYQDFLSRLQKVTKRGSGSWLACCPAHNDTHPSLSIDVGKDGRLLLHCHAGCSNLDVITAVGMSWDDLYPETDRHYRSIAKRNHILERTTDDYIVDLARHQKQMTPKQLAEAERAALRDGKAFGWCEFVADEANK